MVVKYITACGAERVRIERYTTPPPCLVVPLRFPLRIDWNVGVNEPLPYKDREFRFFNIETDKNGRVYIYREVPE